MCSFFVLDRRARRQASPVDGSDHIRPARDIGSAIHQDAGRLRRHSQWPLSVIRRPGAAGAPTGEVSAPALLLSRLCPSRHRHRLDEPCKVSRRTLGRRTPPEDRVRAESSVPFELAARLHAAGSRAIAALRQPPRKATPRHRAFSTAPPGLSSDLLHPAGQESLRIDRPPCEAWITPQGRHQWVPVPGGIPEGRAATAVSAAACAPGTDARGGR